MKQENFDGSKVEKPIIPDKEQIKRMSSEERENLKKVFDEICTIANELAEKIGELNPELAKRTIEDSEKMRTIYQNIISEITSEEYDN